MKSIVIRCLSSRSPASMINEAEVSLQKFERLADFLHENNWLLSEKCDDSKVCYEKFLKSAVRSNKDQFNHFS